jgi:hypothetical protein
MPALSVTRSFAWNKIGAGVFQDKTTDLLHINAELRVSIVLCRHVTTAAGFSRWVVRLDEGLRPDITIAIRMNTSNDAPRDYYLLPAIDMTWETLRVAEDNGFIWMRIASIPSIIFSGWQNAVPLRRPHERKSSIHTN